MWEQENFDGIDNATNGGLISRQIGSERPGGVNSSTRFREIL